jgi:2',3'-cyclic-nucleotide 2'-phosphodiesterase
MKLLIFWDIYGKIGRKMLAANLPMLRTKYSPDAVIVNDENMSHGKGPRMNQILWLESQGVDVFTGGNHSLESRDDIAEYMNTPSSRQLRPHNLVGENLPGVGHRVYDIGWEKLLVINLIGNIFMSAGKETMSNPFQCVDEILAVHAGGKLDAIVVDFHKETTSEGYAMANYLDGRASVLFGTHTHVQSNDAEIWPGGLGFINDIGFAGARRSIIGVDWSLVKHRFVEWRIEWLMSPDEEGVWVLSGMYAEIQERKCLKLEVIRICE